MPRSKTPKNEKSPKTKKTAKSEPAAPPAPKPEPKPAAPVTTSANPFGAAAGAPVLGEVITWGCSKGTTFAYMTAALKTAGLDDTAARELAPRHAFTRACNRLAEERIIRQTAEDGTTITFQFTKESRAGDRFEYALETMLTLEKDTGKVSCPIPELESAAQAEVDRCIAERTAGDVTTTIQRLFERHAALFKIRDQGGCYFVPAKHGDFTEKVEKFVRELSGTIRRFPIPAGTPQGNRSVKESVADGLESLIREHRKAVDEFGENTKPSTFEAAAVKIQQTRFRVEAYAEYLAEEKERLLASLVESDEHLRQAVARLGDGIDTGKDEDDPDRFKAGGADGTVTVGADGLVFLAECDEAFAMDGDEKVAVEAMRAAAELKPGQRVDYKVWKVHPDASFNSKGELVVPAGAPEPELIREESATPSLLS